MQMNLMALVEAALEQRDVEQIRVVDLQPLQHGSAQRLGWVVEWQGQLGDADHESPGP
jgi:hypothetical protein